jgi:hypothetical protein
MPQEAVLPDGTILEFPDQATTEQITQTVNQYAQSSRQPTAAQEPTSETADVARGLARGMGPVALGATAGLLSPIPGGAAMGATAVAAGQLIGDPLVLGMNHFLSTDLKTPTELFGELFTRMGLDPTSTEAGRIAESVGSSVASTAAGIGIGNVLKGAASATARKIGAVLAEKPLQQLSAAAAGGATAEGARYLAEEMGAGTKGQIAASLVGGLTGGLAAGKLAGARTPTTGPSVAGMTAAETAQAISEAESAGRLVRTSDVLQPGGPLSRRMQDVREAVGGRAALVQQSEERTQAVKDLLGQFSATVGGDAIRDVTANLNATRAAELSANTSIVKGILQDLDSTGVTVSTANAVKAIDDEIKFLNGVNPNRLASVITELESFKSGIQGKTASQVAANLKLAGDLLDDPNLASIKGLAGKSMDRVYGAIKQELGDFIEASGRDRNAWESANTNLHEMAKELDDAALRAALNKGTVNKEIASKLLFSKSKSEVELLYKNLDAKGQASARAAILEDVATRSLDNKTKQLSPVQFLGNLGSAEKQTGIFFSGADKNAIDGLTRYLNLTKRAGEFNYDPSTGQKLLLPTIAGMIGHSLGFAGTALVAGATYGLGRLYETPGVRNLLLKMPKVAAGSPEEFALSKRITQAMQSTMQQQAISDIERKKMPVAFMDKTSSREALGDGYVLSDGVNGMKIVSKSDTSHKLFDSNGRLVGIFRSEQEAKDKATKDIVGAIKRELKQSK